MQGFRPLPRFALTAALTLALGGVCGCDEPTRRPPPPSETVAVIAPQVPKLDALTPPCIGHLDTALIRECSGLVASARSPGAFWTFSDSGDTARIFAVKADGSTIRPTSGSAYAGLKITGAENHDWEAITRDEGGRLIIGDIGNNNSTRKKLCLYVLPAEPDPAHDLVSVRARRVPFHYCDQPVIPDPKKNHDAEAMFCWRGGVYVLTKHWTDHWTELHRVDMGASETVSRPTTLVARLNAGGMVTDAATSPSGNRLAILTYTGVWVFELPVAPAAHPLAGRAFFRPLAMPVTSWQVEAIAFTDESTLLLGNEEGDLYRVRFEELCPLRPTA